MSLQFSDLYQAVLDISPTQITTAQAKSAVNRAYLSIARLRRWFGLNTEDSFVTSPDKTNGTITLTQNSSAVVGVNTTFAATDIGRYLRVGSRVLLRIGNVTDATHLTLVKAWGESSISSTAYAIVTLRYTLPSTVERIIRIRGPQWFLVRRNLTLIDAYDPLRLMRNVPLIYTEVEIVGGVKEYELWPVPNSYDTYARSCRLSTPQLVNDTDIPLISPEAIMWRASKEVSKKLYARSGDKAWSETAQGYDEDYQDTLNGMVQEDRLMRGSHPIVFDAEDASPIYDPGFLAFQRAWVSLGLGAISGYPSGYGTATP